MYIRPWLMGKSETEERLLRLEASIAQLQTSAADSSAQMVDTLKAIQESLAHQRDRHVQVRYICSLYFVHFVVPVRISPMRNLGGFPQGKPAATETCCPSVISYRVHRVSIIHQALTWTTGSLTCIRDRSYACVYTLPPLPPPPPVCTPTHRQRVTDSESA